MYLGHLIFLLGLALTLQSVVALGLLVLTLVLLQMHVLEDEKRLQELFGVDYEAYAARVNRWIPYLL
jgi:protein-S-isoprenylcysteine O-methyltransferase Ste14